MKKTILTNYHYPKDTINEKYSSTYLNSTVSLQYDNNKIYEE